MSHMWLFGDWWTCFISTSSQGLLYALSHRQDSTHQWWCICYYGEGEMGALMWLDPATQAPRVSVLPTELDPALLI